MDAHLPITQACALNIATLAMHRYAETQLRASNVTQKEAERMMDVPGANLGLVVRAGKIKLNDGAGVPNSKVEVPYTHLDLY